MLFSTITRLAPNAGMAPSHPGWQLHRAPVPEEEPLEPLPGEEPAPDEEEPPPHPNPSVRLH